MEPDGPDAPVYQMPLNRLGNLSRFGIPQMDDGLMLMFSSAELPRISGLEDQSARVTIAK